MDANAGGVIVATLLIGALVTKFTALVKYAMAKDVNAFVTQLLVWAAGIGAVFLAATTLWTNEIIIGGKSLDTLNTGSKVVAGLMVSSAISVVYDFKKARDNNDSAVEPKLLK